ncbi:MAG: OmpH family outer membrane protein [Bacteroidales bacterium]|nr:OmpH family outer membrane protein [Bacteroidales bacterium]
MKKTTILLGILALAGSISLSSCDQVKKEADNTGSPKAVAGKGTIVYVNLDRILSEYDMANDLSSVVNTEAQGVEQDLNRRGSKIERDQKTFQDKINKGLLTQSTAEAQYKKLQDDQINFQNYANQKQQEIQEKLIVTQNQILNAVSTFLQEYNEEKGYAMILTTQGDNLSVPVACASAEYDITDDVLEGLNKAYVKEKNEPAK